MYINLLNKVICLDNLKSIHKNGDSIYFSYYDVSNVIELDYSEEKIDVNSKIQQIDKDFELLKNLLCKDIKIIDKKDYLHLLHQEYLLNKIRIIINSKNNIFKKILLIKDIKFN